MIAAAEGGGQNDCSRRPLAAAMEAARGAGDRGAGEVPVSGRETADAVRKDGGGVTDKRRRDDD